MSRFEVSRDPERLTLTMALGYRRLLVGCMLLALTIVCITMIGLLAVLHAPDSGPTGSSDPLLFFDRHANHFGFIWLFATVVMGVLVPVGLVRMLKSSLTFEFDKTTGLFTRNGKRITKLAKIEAVRIRRADDADNRSVYWLSVLHGDGFETAIENWYDLAEVRLLAHHVSSFLEVRTTGDPGEDVVDIDAIPGDLRYRT
jgi:hypothetical protein